jgi:hypothetical protein
MNSESKMPSLWSQPTRPDRKTQRLSESTRACEQKSIPPLALRSERSSSQPTLLRSRRVRAAVKPRVGQHAVPHGAQPTAF